MRVASQLTFCSPQQILRQTVVEQDQQKIVTAIFGLDDSRVESARTLFFDGIISSEISSLKEEVSPLVLRKLVKDYQYIDLSDERTASFNVQAGMPLILDFGTTDANVASTFLRQFAADLESLSIFDIIAACTYYPALLLGQSSSLTVGVNTDLLLWENVDLVNKRIKNNTKIRIVG